MKKEEKRKARIRILNLQDAHCTNCHHKIGATSNYKEYLSKIDFCRTECKVGKEIVRLGEKLESEGRTASMGEERNWNQICAKAEQLRADDEKKWTWGKIAEYFGVTEGNLYYHISRRRENSKGKETVKPLVKRVGTSKQQTNAKPLAPSENIVQKTYEAIEVKELKQEDILETLKVQIAELVEEKGQLEKELLAETKLRLQAEDYTEFYQKQYRDLEEDHASLKNEFNSITEKDFEQRAEIKKLHEQLQISHTELKNERSIRLEFQGKSQALGLALKAVL